MLEQSRWQLFLERAYDFRPRPNTGRIWLDGIYVMLLAVIQSGIGPTISSPYWPIDLVTPWLVINMVRQSYGRSLTLVLIAGLYLELHSAVPAGLYLCGYGVAANVIHSLRHTFSWHHTVPWSFTFFCTGLWLVALETLAVTLLGQISLIGWQFPAAMAFRLVTATLVGLMFVQPWNFGLIEDQTA